jgi:hypothetical protein
VESTSNSTTISRWFKNYNFLGISSSSFLELENKISKEVPQNRPNEIYEFMKLFGYKPERSIVQVHLTGFFRKKKYTPREIEQHKTATKR